VPELAFFIGKGGVGKTTVSAAYAVRAALQPRKPNVLLISTDPAHSLSDVLDHELGSEQRRVPVNSRRSLTVWEIDSDRLFQQFLREHKQELVQIIAQGSFFTAQEISSLLDTALPGMSEIAALLAIQEVLESGEYSTVVVDTAPFGHTLRLFSLPEQFHRLLNFLELSADRDRVLAEHFAGAQVPKANAFIDGWRGRVNGLQQAFSGSRLFLVTTAERFALNESVRCIEELQRTNPAMKLSGVVLNRVVGRAGECPRCKARASAAQQAKKEIRKNYPHAKLLIGTDPGIPIAGLERLNRFALSVFSGRPAALGRSTGSKHIELKLKPVPWPRLNAPLSFVLGKGGVGKTTVSAALGFHARQQSNDGVEICSVDPAPSLDDVFQTEIGDESRPVVGDGKFRASELDSVALFRNWVESIRAEIDTSTSTQHSGVHIDLSFERRMFSELLEIVPPGLDEVLAVLRIIDLTNADAQKVIIDMAPTGHALQLLRMPERILIWARLLLKSLAAHRKLALAREAAVKIAGLEVRARELAAALRNPKRTAIYAVMLPEPLPDRETERLLTDLEQIGLAAKAIFVNRVLMPGSASKCVRCNTRAVLQSQVLTKMRRKTENIFVIPEYDHEISGKCGLKEITAELWRLN
jgi:arsenite/tail-anchored protein-transporting ATPase